MAEFTIPNHGELCWRELATSDLEAAKKFYSALFGWKLEQSKITSMPYQEIHLGEKSTGGMMQIDENWGDPPPPPFWSTYIAVDNTDETVKKIQEKGGGVLVPPFDAPGVGRMAMVTDPAGAGFRVIQFIKP
jgi:predicted enzyme related to lactoylglutathione lyase